MSKKFISSVLCALLLALSGPVEAQQPRKVHLIGYVATGSSASPAFRQGLRDLGYIEGQNIAIEYRFTEGREDRFPGLAMELVGLKVDVIVTGDARVALAVKKLTKTIPIVLTNSADPIASGLVASLARPGGNVTGMSFMAPDLTSKGLELLKEAFPGITRVAVIYRGRPAGAATGYSEKVGVTARSLGLELQMLKVQDLGEIENAFSEIRKKRADAFTQFSHPFFSQNSDHILRLVARNRIPAMYPHRSFVEDGGLMSYGPIHSDLHYRAAYFVDKILKGAKPADLPVEQPTKFEFVINLKTAKNLGLTIPPDLLMWADDVIK